MNALAEGTDQFRARFARGERLIGSFIKTPTSHATEILGLTGFDFVVVDAEHAPFDRVTTDQVLLACRAYGITGVVRVADASPAHLLSALDSGATAVLVPHVDSADKAREIVAAGRYFAGARGFSNSPRAGDYGGRSMREHIERSDADVTLIAMIEDVSALDRLDDILAVEGLDGIFIGRGDLAVAMRAESPNTDAVNAAVERITAAARKAGKPVMVMVGNAAASPRFAAQGASAFIVSSDQGLMKQAAAKVLKDFAAL